MEALVKAGLITVTQIVEPSPLPNGGTQNLKVLLVNERDSYVVVARVSPEATAKLVDRWMELENQVASPHPMVPQTFENSFLTTY